MDVDKLTLNCWIRSEDPKAYFRVKISKTETVFGLQNAIKNKISVTLSNVEADTLALYKPKTAVSIPYKERLSKLILSKDGEPLRKLNKLSEIFPEPPPKRDIHVIVDAPSRIRCWLRGNSLDYGFEVKIPTTETVPDLQEAIKNKRPTFFRDVDTDALRLYKISGDESKLQEYLHETGGGERLQEDTIARNFLDVPVLDPLCVVITVEIQSPTLFQETIPHVDDMQEYKDIFLKVEDWRMVEESDIESNHIEAADNVGIPSFVIAFEQKLLQKPRLPLGLRLRTQEASDNPEQYFEPYQTLTAGDSQEEIRHANRSEVFHTSGIAQPNWERAWKLDDLNKPIMASMFFDPFLYPGNGRKTAWKDKRWPITVVVQREGESPRQYVPGSDFLISNSALPRLLVEVNPTPKTRFPKDIRRMLATGAFVVRFANNFVSKFSQRKDFVLCTFFVAWGTATRYNLFQIPDDKKDKVYYTEKAFPLDDPLGRVEFARHLYNLRAELDQKEDQDAKDAVKALVDQVKKCKMKSICTKSETGGGGNGHIALLRAHGYEVEPKVIIDDSGGILEPIYKTPDHILTVYKRTNPNKMLIAKKVHEESNELEILKFLDTMRPKSDHVISLVDSFDEWAIFPQMTTIEYYVDFRQELQNKVPQVCLGLVKGVAYLHRHCIAHRDIKPDNLVVDKNFTLQIIDFDVAMRVKDENEEVDDECGTRHWMAPEVKKKKWHSPIKADRWSCGRVLLFLLDVFGRKDTSLKAFARNLVADDPKVRPSLLEWDRYLAPPFSDSNASKTSQLRRDRVEGDGEMTKSNVKKQRLDSSLVPT